MHTYILLIASLLLYIPFYGMERKKPTNVRKVIGLDPDHIFQDDIDAFHGSFLPEKPKYLSSFGYAEGISHILREEPNYKEYIEHCFLVTEHSAKFATQSNNNKQEKIDTISSNTK